MRILIVTNLFPNARQPQRAIFNLHQFKALAARHRVHIISPVAWTSSLRSVQPIDHGDSLRMTDGGDQGLTIEHPPYFYTPRTFRNRYGHLMAASIRPCFHAAVRSITPDMVLGCWAYPDGWAAATLAREAGLPIVIKVHGSDLMLVDPKRERGGRAGRTREALRMVDGVVAVGRHLKDRAVELGANDSRTWVVRNGVDTGIFTPGNRVSARLELGHIGTSPLILSVGNLALVKGHDLLIRALAELPLKRWRCVVIGQGQAQARLQRLAESLRIHDRVWFLPPRPQRELAEWYRAADMLVLPSRSEGVPNVAMEAAACGTPIIASDVGGVADVVAREGLVPAGDVPSLSARIAAWLDSPPTNASPAAPRSWAQSAAELGSILTTIAATRHTRRIAA